MKHIGILIALTLLCIGCNRTSDEEMRAAIKGDWIVEQIKIPPKPNPSGKKLINLDMGEELLSFSFEDSLCTYFDDFTRFSRYSLQNDTLFIEERLSQHPQHEKGEKKLFRFLIEKLTERELILNPLDKEMKDVCEGKKLDTARIKLKKVTVKNRLTFDVLSFSTGGCYGTCPVMSLEIDSSGNFLFCGIAHVDTIGLFRGKLSTSDLASIRQKINALELDSLREKYQAPWTCDQTRNIIIKSGCKTYSISAYGFRSGPHELRLLFHKLMEVYRNVHLTQDSTIAGQFTYTVFIPEDMLPKDEGNER